jgi:Glycosyltransferase family 87
MTVNAPLGATSEGGTLDVTATAVLVGPTHTLRRPRTRTRAERIGISATLAVPVLGLLLCVAGTRTQALLPESIALAPSASGMAGPLAYFGFTLSVGEVVAALLALLIISLTAIRYSEHVPQRLIVGAVVAFTVVAVIGPPLFSTDVFSYQAYAQMFTHYHINPYLFGPEKALGSYPVASPLSNYIAAKWMGTASVYGPLFTFFSAVFGGTSIPFNYYAFKVIAALASGGTLYLIWKSAERRGVSPKRGVALFGLNPMVTLYGVGGGHNDLLMLLLTTSGIYAMLTRRAGTAGSLFTAGAAIKLTGAIVLPFALLGQAAATELRSGRRRILVGVAATSAVVAAVSYAAFGTGILHMLHTLQSVQDQGAWQSLPGFVFSLTHMPVTHAVRIADDVVLAGTSMWLLHRVWRGRMDWIEGAAWATFAVLITAWSLLPWYSAWMMPLVALTSNRRLWNAAVVATLMGGAIMIAGCFPGWNWL